MPARSDEGLTLSIAAVWAAVAPSHEAAFEAARWAVAQADSEADVAWRAFARAMLSRVGDSAWSVTPEVAGDLAWRALSIWCERHTNMTRLQRVCWLAAHLAAMEDCDLALALERARDLVVA